MLLGFRWSTDVDHEHFSDDAIRPSLFVNGEIIFEALTNNLGFGF